MKNKEKAEHNVTGEFIEVFTNEDKSVRRGQKKFMQACINGEFPKGVDHKNSDVQRIVETWKKNFKAGLI